MTENECKEMLYIVNRMENGDRYWEDDIALTYNESAKMRTVHMQKGIPMVTPGPSEEALPAIPFPSLFKKYNKKPTFHLPRPLEVDSGLGATLIKRRSRRDYTGEPLTQAELSTILHYSAGINSSVAAYGFSKIPLRMFPSSGGLQSPEIYLSIFSAEGLKPGLYHYRPIDHSIEQLKDCQLKDRFIEICIGQEYVKQSCMAVIITGLYERLKWKYGERAYRYMFLDAGTLAENIYLVAESLGLGACAIAGFIDDNLATLLETDNFELPLLLITIGRIKNKKHFISGT